MALSNLIFTAGNAPDHTQALIDIAKTRPNLAEAAIKGRAAANSNALALQQYRALKQKADLAEALYPQQLAYDRASLLAKTAAYNNLGNGNPYGGGLPSTSAVIGPTGAPVAPAAAGGAPTASMSGGDSGLNPFAVDDSYNLGLAQPAPAASGFSPEEFGPIGEGSFTLNPNG